MKQFIEDYRLDVNALNSQNQNIAHILFQYNVVDVLDKLKYLKGKNIKLDQEDSEQNTPMHHFATYYQGEDP